MAARVSAHCGARVKGAKPGSASLGRRMAKHAKRKRCSCSSVCLHLFGTYCTDCGGSV